MQNVSMKQATLRRGPRSNSLQTVLWGILTAVTVAMVPMTMLDVRAETRETETFEFRVGAGAAVPTQTVLKNTDNHTDVSSIVNFEGLYVVKEWLRVGIMYQYVPLTIDLASGGKFGSLQTHSVLPTVEVRPTENMLRDQWFKGMSPYLALGVGANWHLFKSGSAALNNAAKFPVTPAFRVATGFDVPITEYVSFNAEVAWNRDAGTYRLNGTDADFNASAVNVLGGLRLKY